MYRARFLGLLVARCGGLHRVMHAQVAVTFLGTDIIRFVCFQVHD